ncbi:MULTISPECIES: hypothetical protein [unclassified Rhizobium]|nr:MULTISPECIES: hypothetical protein [unclassified Rhizobium]
MTGLTIHIDDETEARLRRIADELHRDVHDLASGASHLPKSSNHATT